MIAKRFRPAVLWLMVVLLLGSAQFGPKQTQRHIVPTLQALAPWMSPADVQTTHTVLRKLAHLMEYAFLALFWVQAFRVRRRFTLKTASWAALAVCLVCAVVDEAHQTTLPERTGSVRDVVLDTLGAAAMLVVVRSRRERGNAENVPPDTSDTRLTTVRLDKGA